MVPSLVPSHNAMVLGTTTFLYLIK